MNSGDNLDIDLEAASVSVGSCWAEDDMDGGEATSDKNNK